MSDKTVLDQVDKKMAATIQDARHKLAAVRTGRASLAMFDGVVVDYYGTMTPLNQVAKLSIPEPSLVVAQPFDPSTLPAIEKAIKAADLGLNPANDGKLVRIAIPPLTEERRKQLAKKVRELGEEAKTAIRMIRRDANEDLKKLEKDGKVSQDDARRATDDVQKRTDKFSAEVDTLVKSKEKEGTRGGAPPLAMAAATTAAIVRGLESSSSSIGRVSLSAHPNKHVDVIGSVSDCTPRGEDDVSRTARRARVP